MPELGLSPASTNTDERKRDLAEGEILTLQSGWLLSHLNMFWGAKFSYVPSHDKLSVQSLALNLSLRAACKTEDILIRQQGTWVPATARVQQAPNLDLPLGCEQHRKNRTEAAHTHFPVACTSGSTSKITAADPHLPSALSVLILQGTYVGEMAIGLEKCTGEWS